MSIADYAKVYAHYYERIAPDNLDELGALLSDDVIFIDPFNKLEGRQIMVSVFAQMFKTMTNPRFEILDVACSENRAYMKWRMTGTVNAAPSMPFDILGMSEVSFTKEGLVMCHHDHWDSGGQLLAKLPYVGWLTKRMMRLFAH
jgi:steroid delta-isomerase